MRCECKRCDCPAQIDDDEWRDGVRICHDCDIDFHFDGEIDRERFPDF